ncbi:hypothetical protein BP5796_09370 [Coleophoma crateriformis]|uniref:Major facilitator superfamily (MFS) profile domain-containing protein n=1 Tax=Coleophoma crateriformis TaxID=565419 RepID=A0A3D8QY63_9HELO|nr:hypothetical protein BP5796_09370 [Coleophoma crateriformis]
MAEKISEEKKPGESEFSNASIFAPSLSATAMTPGELDPPTDSIRAENATDPNSNGRTLHGFRWFLVCFSLYFSCVIYGLDTTIAADVQAAVIVTFEDIGQLTWMGTGFPLGSLCAILPWSALYTRFDMKKLIIGGTILFEVGSALCGAAPTMDALVVGRVLAGFGGSGMYIGILNYLSMLTTTKERGGYMSGMGLAWGFGAILGPVIGGGFSISSATWRWSFYINF